MRRIVVLGAGFAGLIAAVGAARKLSELNIPKSDIAVTVVNRDPWHAIRVRNYETDLSDVRVPLDDVLGPIGVELVIGEVTGIDCGSGLWSRAARCGRLRWATTGWFLRSAANWCGRRSRGWRNTVSTSTPTMRRPGLRRTSTPCRAARPHPAGSRRW